MKSVNYFPVDIDALTKGQVLLVEEIENILGCSRSAQPQFALKALGLRNKIAKMLRDRGKPATVVLAKGTIRVLTDAEAVEYNPRQYRHGARKMARAHKRSMDVDPALLTCEQLKKHERSVIVQGCILQAIDSQRRRLAIAIHQRQTPGLLK